MINAFERFCLHAQTLPPRKAVMAVFALSACLTALAIGVAHLPQWLAVSVALSIAAIVLWEVWVEAGE